MTSPQASRNYYDVLHVSRDAPVEIIRSSYRTLMQRLKNHPDLGGDAATAALINEAYAALTDIERRAEYDALFDASEPVGASSAEGPEDVQPSTEHFTPAAARPLDPFLECVFCRAAHDHGNVIDPDAKCSICNSPLCPVEKRRLETTGKRAVARISKRQAITYYTHWPQPESLVARTEDISLHGMRFTTNGSLDEGQCIKIVGRTVEAVGVVTHCSKIGRRGALERDVIGISFVTVRLSRSVGAFISDQV